MAERELPAVPSFPRGLKNRPPCETTARRRPEGSSLTGLRSLARFLSSLERPPGCPSIHEGVFFASTPRTAANIHSPSHSLSSTAVRENTLPGKRREGKGTGPNRNTPSDTIAPSREHKEEQALPLLPCSALATGSGMSKGRQKSFTRHDTQPHQPA
jgi:hypothetical protein